MSLYQKLVFYPTISYGIFMEYMGFRQWYTRIDDHCVLGALPLRHNYERIVKNENIKAILTLNEEHELALSLSKQEWQNMGIDYLQIPIPDFTGLPNIAEIQKAVDYINTHKNANNCVYVHCKAGRYRSALMVACYLLHSNRDLTIEQVISHLKGLRSFVILEKEPQIELMTKYRESL